MLCGLGARSPPVRLARRRDSLVRSPGHGRVAVVTTATATAVLRGRFRARPLLLRRRLASAVFKKRIFHFSLKTTVCILLVLSSFILNFNVDVFNRPLKMFQKSSFYLSSSSSFKVQFNLQNVSWQTREENGWRGCAL